MEIGQKCQEDRFGMSTKTDKAILAIMKSKFTAKAVHNNKQGRSDPALSAFVEKYARSRSRTRVTVRICQFYRAH
jgi:hypothetical protein